MLISQAQVNRRRIGRTYISNGEQNVILFDQVTNHQIFTQPSKTGSCQALLNKIFKDFDHALWKTLNRRRQILAKGDHLSSLSGRERFESLIPDVMWHGELGIYGDDEGKNQKLRMFIEIQNYLIR